MIISIIIHVTRSLITEALGDTGIFTRDAESIQAGHEICDLGQLSQHVVFKSLLRFFCLRVKKKGGQGHNKSEDHS